jgi:hypothetical protein
MAKAKETVEAVNSISPKVLVIVGGIAIVGLAVYEILKGGSTSQQQKTVQSAPSQYSYQPTITPTIIPNANPTYSILPTISSIPRASGGSVVYAPVEEVVSTYSPYTSSSVVYSPTTTTSTYTYTSNQTSSNVEYSSSGLSTINVASPHNIGANQFVWGV